MASRFRSAPPGSVAPPERVRLVKERPSAPSAVAPSIEQRLTRVEKRLDEISLIVERLAGQPPARAAPLSAEPDDESLNHLIPQNSTVLNALQQLGRSCLILGGAFLIRAVTEAGGLPRAAGAALGLLYAIAWTVAADRSARRGRILGGTFLGVTAIAIADPLVFETATRFHVIGPAGAAALLAGLTILSLEVARRRALPVLAWTSCLGAVAAAAALSISTGASEPFAAALLSVGVATVWMAGSARGWRALRWPTGAAVDLLAAVSVLRLTAAEPGATRSESAAPIAALGAALALLYLGTFAARALSRRAELGAFEVLQSAAVVTIGAAIAIAAASAGGFTLEPVGVGALVLGAAAYAAALGLSDRPDGRRNARYFGAVGIALTLLGTFLILDSSAAALLWSGLGAAAFLFASASRRDVLIPHAAGYAAAAAWRSGLAEAAFDALFSSAGRGPAAFPIAALAALAFSALGLAWLVWRKGPDPENDRMARIVFAAIVCLGACGFAAALLRPLVGIRQGAVDAGGLAVLRTGILAAAALLAGTAGRRGSLAELRWLAGTLLAVGAGKLLFEDLPAGRPATLFLGFVVYGAALLSLPRLLRRAPSA